MTNVDISIAALRQQNRLQLSYGGHRRTVEVHAIGNSKVGKTLIRVWQTEGDSRGAKSSGWKLLHLDEATNLTLTEEVSAAPRVGFKSGDRAMAVILAQC